MLNGAGGPALPTVAVIAADRRVRKSLASLLGALRLVSGGAVEVVVVGSDVADGAAGSALLPQLRGEAPDARIFLIEWGSPAEAVAASAADAVLDLAERPSALLDAVLAGPRRPDRGGASD